MGCNSKNYRFFISHKVIGVEVYNKKYEVKLQDQDAVSVMCTMFGLVTPSIISDIRDVMSRCTFTNDYQVVEIPKKLFTKHGYDFISVSERCVCFVSKCHNIGNYSLVRDSECECLLMSVLKNQDTKLLGDIDDNLNDTMIFAL